jgi:hypothetical protein
MSAFLLRRRFYDFLSHRRVSDISPWETGVSHHCLQYHPERPGVIGGIPVAVIANIDTPELVAEVGQPEEQAGKTA